MQTWFPVINHCTSCWSLIKNWHPLAQRLKDLPFLLALFMKQVCANMCTYYNAQKLHFWGEYRHPSVTAVQTLLLPSAHPAMSLWKCWLWSVTLTKPTLSRTSAEGEETTEIQMRGIQWSLDVCSLLLCGKVLNLGEFCLNVLIPPAMKNWCTHQCSRDNVLFQAAFQFGHSCMVKCRAKNAAGNSGHAAEKEVALEDTLRTDSSRNAGGSDRFSC